MASEDMVGAVIPIDTAAISAAYHDRAHIYAALAEEICFILEERIRTEEIKIHAIEKRVKTLNSLLDKCSRKNCANPFAEFDDIAAARVICLFRSDIEKLKTLLENSFFVEEIDDKLNESDNSLGYLSIHFKCKMKPEYTGPRYEKISDIHFEIQLRTLCMHCWAAVSHYLDYKGDWDVPANLKRGLSALSGLFYVADDEFEQFYAARLEFKNQTASQMEAKSTVDEINFDTIAAYLEKKFLDRKKAHSDSISEFVKELKNFGYKTIAEVNRDVDRAIDAANQWEREEYGEDRFTAVGMARAALDLASREYGKRRGVTNRYGTKYFKLVKSGKA